MAQPDRKQINEQWSEAALAAAEGRTKNPGMTFEEGVETALAWVLGHSNEPPMDD